MSQRVRVCVEPDPDAGPDATDLETFGHTFELEGDDTRARAIVNLFKHGTSGAGAEIHILAGLPPAEYERRRKEEAKRLGMRASVLDEEVAKLRDQDGSRQGQAVKFDEPEPWAESVDVATLLDTLRRLIHRHVVVDDHAAVAIALWVAITYMVPVLSIFAFLLMRSPVLRCGKTSVLTLVGLLAYRALSASNISPAAIYRTIEAAQPTLIVDEYDTVANGNDDLRGILNSGHKRSMAFVVRLVGDDHEPRRFSTFGAKALALIGNPPNTILDRSIVIDMRRKNANERIAKLPDEHDTEIRRLRSMLARLAKEHAEAIRSASPLPVPGLNDRATDNWAPLLAVAEIAGDPWRDMARMAALKLSGGHEAEAEGVRVQLLEDLQRLFSERKVDRLLSQEICDYLVGLEHRPWPEYGRKRKPITPPQVARLLEPFKIRPGTKRAPPGTTHTGKDTAKGYYREQFMDVFARYLPAKPSHRHNTEKTSAAADFQSVTNADHVTDRKTEKPLETQDCDDVTDEMAPPEGADDFFEPAFDDEGVDP